MPSTPTRGRTKVNLSIGIYFDEQGRLPVLPSVQQAEARVLAAGGAKGYLPMEGERRLPRPGGQAAAG